MSSRKIGIEEARKGLGDIVTAVQQGADILLTRNGKPSARLCRIADPAPMRLSPDLAAIRVEHLTEYAPDEAALFQRWSAEWTAMIRAAKENGRLAQEIERAARDDLDGRDEDGPLPVDVEVKIVAHQGAFEACDRARAETEEHIAALVGRMEDAARRAGAGDLANDLVAD